MVIKDNVFIYEKKDAAAATVEEIRLRHKELAAITTVICEKNPSDRFRFSYYFKNLEKVVLKKGVKKVGKGTFKSCFGLKTVEFCETLTEVGAEAFRGCVRLAGVRFPSALASIGEGCFRDCSELKEIIIPRDAHLTELPVYFAAGTKVQEFVCPDNLVTIDVSAFAMSELRSVTLNEGLKNISGYAFDRTPLSELTIPASLETYDTNRLPELGRISIAEGNKTFRMFGNAFCDNSGTMYHLLRTGTDDIAIPEGVKSMREGVSFRKCKRLFIPKTLTHIGGVLVQERFDELEKVFVHADNPQYKAENGILYTKDGRELILVPPKLGVRDLVFPQSVCAVRTRAICHCELGGIVFTSPELQIYRAAFAYMSAESILFLGSTHIAVGSIRACNVGTVEFAAPSDANAFNRGSAIGAVAIRKEPLYIGMLAHPIADMLICPPDIKNTLASKKGGWDRQNYLCI